MKTPPMRTPSYRSVHSPDSYVRRAVDDMPGAVDRIWNLREDLNKDYYTKRRKYAGELGINTYEGWQLPDYFMVRSLLEEFIDDFLIKHVPPDIAIYERSMKLQMLKYNEQDWHQTSTALSERSAVKLVAEEILLEVTSKLHKDIASEGIHQDLMFKRMSSNMFMKESEVQATGILDGRDPNDSVYDLITRTFHSMQKNRDHHKKGVWGHSQPMSHPVVPPPQPLQRDPVPQPPSQKSKKSKKSEKKPEKKSQTPAHVVKQE